MPVDLDIGTGRHLRAKDRGNADQSPNPEHYLIIDGYQRVAALEQLGRDTVEAVVWSLSEAEALLLDRSMRSGDRETALEEGWLLVELEQRFGYGLEGLARCFDRSTSWVSRPVTVPGTLALNYVRPTQRTKVNNYIFDAFGPYPFAVVGVAAGINQWSDTPPEWGEGVNGYGKRYGSDFAIATIATTTRYGLAQPFREDTLYYRCECAGPFLRLRHAVVSTLTGRRGEDGHRVFSFSALAAPYAGSMTAVYGWYPNRFGAKDGFRMGNYSLLGSMGGNIALEFFYSGPHAVISRMHLNNAHGAPDPGPNH